MLGETQANKVTGTHIIRQCGQLECFSRFSDTGIHIAQGAINITHTPIQQTL